MDNILSTYLWCSSDFFIKSVIAPVFVAVTTGVISRWFYAKEQSTRLSIAIISVTAKWYIYV